MPTTGTASFAAFRVAHPAYAETAPLDTLRATEYVCLDVDGHVYLDYTGAGCMPLPNSANTWSC